MRRVTSNAIALSIACASVIALGLTAFSSEAEACGGLFCNNTRPVNQAAERIIFSDNEDDTVTAVVQIMYQGPSENFAWVLPVPGAPEVELSSNLALDRLQNASNPIYRMNTTVEGECATDNTAVPTVGASDAESAGVNSATRNEDGQSPVEVVDQGQAGPYDYTTISLDPSAEDPADVAIDWLESNNYDVSSVGPELIGPYLEDGMNLIAFKLTKNAESGDIRPIRITYESELPMIPIKLTAVAANDDMGVLTWVLSKERAIPKNYKHLELNQAALNWFNPSSNYNDVISQAANEADGQGFVTEFAGSARDFRTTVFNERDQGQWESIESGDWEFNHGELVRQSGYFFNWDGYDRVIKETLPLPSDIPEDEFIQNPNRYPEVFEMDQIEGFNPETFISALEEEVVNPVKETQALIGSLPYMTRLYTTMSAEEMTLDPVFDFNASLGNHPRRHVAERVIECTPHYTRSNAPWRAELPQGDVVYGQGRSWPLASGDEAEMPATRRIRQESSDGPGMVVTDNSTQINRLIEENNNEIQSNLDGGCVCSSVDAQDANAERGLFMAVLLGLAGIFSIARRRQK